MTVGADTILITPPLGVELGGYGFGPSVGVLDPLEAQTLVLTQGDERLAVVTADLLTFGPPALRDLERAVRDRTGIPADRLVAAASHSHSTPTLQSLRQWGVVDPGYARAVVQALARSVQKAAESAVPARVGWAADRAPGLGGNRRAGQSVVDPGVCVLRFDDRDGRPLAVLYTFGCHPVTLHGYRNLLSPDYPGHARRLVRLALGAEVPVLFGLGPSGDINPADYYHGGPSEVKARRMGSILGCVVAKAALECVSHDDAVLEIRTAVLDLPVEPLPPRATLEALRDRSAHEATRARSAGATRQELSEIEIRRDWAADALGELGGAPAATLACLITAVRLGGAALVTLPLEVFAGTGLAIRASSPFDVTLIATNTGGCLGYLPPADAYDVEDYTNPEGMAPKVYGVYALSRDAEPLVRERVADMIRSLS